MAANGTIVTNDAAGAEDAAGGLPRDGRIGVFKRIGRNVGWLLGGRGFAGVVSLAYLAIAARAMGPDRFGSFTLILTYGQLIANLVQFQSWKGVIRFGALHLAEDRPDRLARLTGFTATLDLASALIGAALAVVGVHLAAPLLHWSAQEQNRAALFGAVLLLSTGATATGMLRLFDRFDLLTLTEAVAPLVRLVGAIGVWALGGGVVAFLTVWAIAALAQAIAGWAAVIAIHGSRLSFGRSAFAGAVAENRKLWRFMLQTNLSNSLSLFWLQTGTLAVGAVAGPAAAGGFRIADRLAKGIAKPVETITRALYPELARLVASNDRATLIAVFKRITWIAASLALVLVVIAGVGGSLILSLIAGRQFAFAHVYLFLLAIAAAIDLSGFALEPFHNAHGRAGRVLRSRAVGAGVYALLLAVLLPTVGAIGAAIAAIVTSLVIFVQLALSARQLLGRPLESGTPDEIAVASLESGVDSQP
jgi:O-antigen/teichoic acid export membrane protein